jgi:hypothetical protein
MAFITVTSTTNSVCFNANDYSTAFGWSKRTRLKSSLITITLHPNFVEYLVNTHEKYNLHFETNSNSILIVDTIDGVAPTSLDDLYNKMIAIVA